jgi:hypothetical protein
MDTLDPLTKLKNKVTKNLPEPLLLLPTSHRPNPTPSKLKNWKANDKQKMAAYRSPRFKNANMRQKSVVKMAQEVLAKKWGLLNSDRDLEEITLQQYMDLYKKLLSQLAVVVVHKLIEVTEMKKKKKMVAKKEGTKSKSKASLLKADVPTA